MNKAIGVLVVIIFLNSERVFAQEGRIWGTITGRIVVEGSVPVLPDLVTKGDPTIKNAEVCALKAIPDEKLVIGKEGGLANCFVFLNHRQKGLDVHPLLQIPARIEIQSKQEGCRFIPHAVIVRTNQKIRCTSSDAHIHNIHTFPVKNNPSNLLIAANDQKGFSLEFRKPEPIPIEVKCDIHPWMSARWLVVDHPYAVLSDKKGNFTIKQVPAGLDLKLRIWHETAGFIKKGKKRDIEVTFSASRIVDLGVIKIAVTKLEK